MQAWQELHLLTLSIHDCSLAAINSQPVASKLLLQLLSLVSMAHHSLSKPVPVLVDCAAFMPLLRMPYRQQW